MGLSGKYRQRLECRSVAVICACDHLVIGKNGFLTGSSGDCSQVSGNAGRTKRLGVLARDAGRQTGLASPVAVTRLTWLRVGSSLSGMGLM